MAARIDFPAIASAALSRADYFLNLWLPGGTRKGHEYSALNPNRGDHKAGSFSINMVTGAWGDFATDDAGGDLISLCAYLFHVGDNLEAAYEIAEQCGIEMPPRRGKPKQTTKKPKAPPPSTKPKKEVVEWIHISPVPQDAEPAPLAHFRHGRPQLTWPYRDATGALLGYVYRFDLGGGEKETLPLCYVEHPETHGREWRWLAFEQPRPMYGLDRLAAKPNAYVLLVEGEKCADAPVELLPNTAVVSWPGGGKAVGKIDWSPLIGRNVIAWADCDAQHEPLTKEEKAANVDPHSKPLLPEAKQPGMKAMLEINAQLHALGGDTRFRLVKIPPPGEKPGGWDIYDAIHSDGMGNVELVAMLKDLRDPPPIDEATQPQPSATVLEFKPQSAKQPDTPPIAGADSELFPPEPDDWYQNLVKKKGEVVSCLANVFDMLTHTKEWQGTLGFDESAQRIMKLKKPPYAYGEPGEWADQDDARTVMWLSRRFHITPTGATVAEAVDILARENSYHPIRDWLSGLQWDGTPRLDSWMVDYLGVDRTPYTEKVSRWFLLGMVYRAMQPGCKFDYCLVLEGNQGLKKSTILRALGGEWFGDTDLDLHNKDSMEALRGKWLHEFAEMGSLARVEASKQKSFIVRQVDEFRPAYGTRTVKFPRQVCFAGTVNEWEWNKDPSGARRFWPMLITHDLDVDAFSLEREQLFAEAYEAWKARERYWPTPEEQEKLFDPVQIRRGIQDPWIDRLADWLDKQTSGEVTLAEAMAEGLGLPPKDQSQTNSQRAGSILVNKLAWIKRDRGSGKPGRFYYVPSASVASSRQHAQQGNDREDIPF